MNKGNVLIIGCGSIGALKDNKYDSPDGKNILTHAHAFRNHPLTNMLIFYDKDTTKAKQAAQKWNGIFYLDLFSAIDNTNPDIIIVSVDTKYHYDILLEIYKMLKKGDFKLKLIIVEKPFTNNYNEAEEINTLFSNINIPIMIDYSRRFDPSIQKFKHQIESGSLYPIYNTVLTYTRGFKRDASHGIDLFNFLFGEFQNGYILNPEKSFNDFSKDDKTYAAYLSYEYCPHIFIAPVDGNDYDIFDINIYAQKSRHNFTDHGKRYNRYLARMELIYGNYYSMPTEILYTEETQLTKTLYLLVQNAYDYIYKGSTLLCNAKDAINVHKIFEHLCI